MTAGKFWVETLIVIDDNPKVGIKALPTVQALHYEISMPVGT